MSRYRVFLTSRPSRIKGTLNNGGLDMFWPRENRVKFQVLSFRDVTSILAELSIELQSK